MKAIGIINYLPVEDVRSFVDFETEKPEPAGRDVLVEVKAIAVNPVDVKVRAGRGNEGVTEEPPRIIGWDASGVVEAVGPDVTLFKPGDEVFYAGDITRPGSNAEFQRVDERIVGHKPKSLSHAEAAALPLTTITAYEAFFDRLGIDRDGGNKGESILIIGAGGGVGSIAIQLARQAGLVIIATASRPETTAWVKELGADHVVNHRGDMVAEARALGFKYIDHIAIFNDMRHWQTAVELIRPQGGIVSIDDTHLPMLMEGMKMKAASLHWEFMFARAMHQTPDMIEQHKLLSWVAAEIDAGRIRTTVSEVLSPINAANLREAHRLIETGQAKGKIVLDGFFQGNPSPEHSPGATLEERLFRYLDLHAMQAKPHRWRFDLRTGETREEPLSDRVMEFGTINGGFAGRPYRYSYDALPAEGWFGFEGVVKHDVETGREEEHRLPEGVYASETAMAPRDGATAEDDGYLVTFTMDLVADRSECLVLDAANPAAGPLARIALPERICSGTHAFWAPAAAL